MAPPPSSKDLYPAAFINWAGSKSGGVRTPFIQTSGRPTGKKIETPLTKRLDNWISDLVKGADVPRAVLLIGGPGNGKTDAVEACIERLDQEINAGGALVERFSSQYVVGDGNLPPRKSVVDFSDLFRFPINLTSEIQLIQDATEKDSNRSDEAPEALLNEELSSVLSGKYTGIYICCINRGILANASSLAHRQANEPLIQLINDLVKSASGGPNSPECWPLNNSSLAIWPMDADSLVAPNTEGTATVMHQILNLAFSAKKWQPSCSNKLECPFCQNKELLSDEATRDNLVKLLHFYELCASKRWTFRDLYSLISYLFVGEQEGLIIDKKLYDPCGWTAAHLSIIRKGTDSYAVAKSRYLLMGRLYHHRLFSLWPRFNKDKHFTYKRDVLKIVNIESGYSSVKNHFKYLKSSSSEESSSIKLLLRNSFSLYLDPALISGEVCFFKRTLDNQSIDVTARLIDERFSLSVDDGLKLVSKKLPEMEKQVLKELSLADEYLMPRSHSPLLANKAAYLQASIRQYCSRLVKRSLGVKFGLCQNFDLLTDYVNIYQDVPKLKNVVKLVRLLINKDKSFPIPLSTTFGQPIAHRKRDVSLLVAEIKPKIHPFYQGTAKPIEDLPYIEIHKDRFLPITFSLFKSLREVKAGLNPASLPEEIFTMLDEVKSIVAGEIVRDDLYLGSSAVLKIGTTQVDIDVEELVFDGV